MKGHLKETARALFLIVSIHPSAAQNASAFIKPASGCASPGPLFCLEAGLFVSTSALPTDKA